MANSSGSGRGFELRTLGGVSLTARGPSRTRSIRLSPRPLALLTYLAVDCPLGHRRRDDIVGLLWPELSEDRARASLSQALYLIRRELGDDALITHGIDVVGANLDVLWCDAVAFADALAAGEPRAALTLYEGRFLKGFHLADSAGFEQWLGTVSERLQRKAVEAARLLARRSEEAGDLPEAVRCAGRALDLSPFDEAVLGDLVRLLDASGERPRALRIYGCFVERLRDELDVDPSPETKALVERIRQRTEANALPSRTGVPPSGTRVAPGTGSEAPTRPPGAQADLAVPVPVRGRRRWPRLALAAAAILASAALLWTSRTRPVLEPGRVLVGSVADRTADPALGGIAASMAERMVQSLSLMDFVSPVLLADPAAQTEEDGTGTPFSKLESLRESAEKAGATTVVLGSAERAGASLVLRAQVVDVATGRVTESVEERTASTARRDEAIEALAHRVAAAIGGRVDPRLADWSSRGDPPPSFPAFLEFVRGVELVLGPADYPQPEGALEYFDRAARMDSTFFTPRVWAVVVHSTVGKVAVADSLAADLTRILERLPLRDRYLLEYWRDKRNGRIGSALGSVRRAMIFDPDAEYMPLAVMAAIEAGHPQEAVVWLTEADTAGWAAHWGQFSWFLPNGYHKLDMHERELEAARRAARVAPDDMWFQYPEVRALAELGNPELDARLAEILERPDPPYARGEALCLAAAESRGHGHLERGAELLDRCIRWDADHLEVGGNAPRLRMAWSLLHAGRFAEAREHLENLAAILPEDLNAIGPLGVLEAGKGHRDAAERIAVSIRERAPGPPGMEYMKVFWRAAIAARLGQAEEAVRILRQFTESGGRSVSDPHDLFLEPLWSYPPFAQLFEARG